MDIEKFWNQLTDENKDKALEMYEDCAINDGRNQPEVIGAWEDYCAGAEGLGMTVEDYNKEIDPNEYIEQRYLQKED